MCQYSPFRAVVALCVLSFLFLGTVSPSSAALRDLWPFGKKTVEEPIPDPLPYAATLIVEGGDRKLRKALTKASGLVGSEKTPPSGLTGLISRARQDLGRLTSVLYENALYAGEVFIFIDGKPLATIGPFDAVGASPVPVVIQIIPGRPFVFGQVNASPLPPGASLEKLSLVPGAPAGSSIILSAEASLLDAWRNEGYPLAETGLRDTVADHRNDTLDVTLNFDPGPIADFGPVSVVGTENVRPDLVEGRADLYGGLYSTTAVRRAEQRLRDLGVFESVRITHADHVGPDGTIPMTITVSERKARVIGATAAYSNTDGLGVDAFWRHRNLFGGAEQLEFRASVSQIISDFLEQDYRLAGTFKKPAVFDPMTDFTFRLEGYRETTDAYRVTAVETEMGLAHMFSDTVDGSIDLELARSQTVDDNDVTKDHLLLTMTGALAWDTRDNRLDPTKGFRAAITAAPAYDFMQNKAFATLGGDLSVYRAFGPTDRFVLAGRVAATSITVDDITDVAPNKRAYLGGAGTVRGYAYQNIAPRDAEGDIVGGRSSILFSGEVRYRLNDQFGLVAFADAGNAYSSIFPEFSDLKVGVGAGVRYLTPVGPVRFDVAVPLQPEDGDPSVAVYVGLGQAF